MKDYGVKVRLIKEACYGYITRRFNAEAYEIVTEDDRVFVLSPKEFEEEEVNDDQ